MAYTSFLEPKKCRMCGRMHGRKSKTFQSVKCVDPYADGYDAFGAGLDIQDTTLEAGTIGWYLFHEGWMIAKNGFPIQPFAFIHDEGDWGKSLHGERGGRVYSPRFGLAKIYADDEFYDAGDFCT